MYSNLHKITRTKGSLLLRYSIRVVDIIPLSSVDFAGKKWLCCWEGRCSVLSHSSKVVEEKGKLGCRIEWSVPHISTVTPQPILYLCLCIKLDCSHIRNLNNKSYWDMSILLLIVHADDALEKLIDSMKLYQ